MHLKCTAVHQHLRSHSHAPEMNDYMAGPPKYTKLAVFASNILGAINRQTGVPQNMMIACMCSASASTCGRLSRRTHRTYRLIYWRPRRRGASESDICRWHSSEFSVKNWK